MQSPDRQSATRLLQAWRGGDRAALDRLLPVVYDELAGLAHNALRSERSDHTLQTRALVHEAYIRLVDTDIPFQDRAHFMAIAARTMRRILVDYARSRVRQKRGGGAIHIDIDEAKLPAPDDGMGILLLHDALEQLASFDPRKAEIVELHFFGGLTYDETAAAVGLSAATVDRELRMARAWLKVEMAGRPAS